MPEGDTIFRAARTLNQALAGRTVLRFQSVLPTLARLDAAQPIRGRVVERVSAHGKHLLIWLSGGLVLRTHMRMHGSWHVYRPGERWQRPRSDMRIVLGTDRYEAVAFSVPVAEFIGQSDVERHDVLGELGPDVLHPAFDDEDAVRRLRARPEMEIGEALLDQRTLSGIGNIWKSESLFAAGVNPFTRVANLPDETVAAVVKAALRLMRASASGTGDIRLRPYVYMRGGKPCRRCGAPVLRKVQGADARSTYWCERCQPR